ncbi:MAG: hypothetical protein U5L06_15195 [Rhodovibrio sp.]|nr:hypothetical protein [Rhodovibrio sp.]
MGQAVARALDDRKGIQRYGDAWPADGRGADAGRARPARTGPTWSGRSRSAATKWATSTPSCSGEFFQAFAHNAGITLHVETLYGDNNHHIAESAFKALARALRAAVEIDPRKADQVPSTKGAL